MPKKEFTISIEGGYGLSNFGDDALMYALHHALLEFLPENEICYTCTKANYFPNMNIHSKVYSLNTPPPAKVKLYGGGTQFYCFNKRSSLTEKFIRVIRQPNLLLKKLFRKKPVDNSEKYSYVLAAGIGLGPFEVTSCRAKTRTQILLKKLAYIAVRDPASEQLLKTWELSPKTISKHLSDICYLLPTKQKAEGDNSTSSELKEIGIIVRDWNHTTQGQQYYSEILKTYHLLLNQDYNVTFLIFSTLRDNYWLKTLENYPNKVIWNPNQNTIHGFLSTLKQFDLLITARYHGAIFASLLEIPFISIVVEQKLAMVSDLYEASSEKWSHPFIPEDCVNKVVKITESYPLYKSTIDNVNKQQQLLAQEMIKDITAFIVQS